jgi:hypothetical protein
MRARAERDGVAARCCTVSLVRALACRCARVAVALAGAASCDRSTTRGRHPRGERLGILPRARTYTRAPWSRLLGAATRARQAATRWREKPHGSCAHAPHPHTTSRTPPDAGPPKYRGRRDEKGRRNHVASSGTHRSDAASGFGGAHENEKRENTQPLHLDVVTGSPHHGERLGG